MTPLSLSGTLQLIFAGVLALATIAAGVWIAVVTHQRDTARVEVAHLHEAVAKAKADALAEDARLAAAFSAQLKAAQAAAADTLAAAQHSAEVKQAQLHAALNDARHHDPVFDRCMSLHLPDGVRESLPH